MNRKLPLILALLASAGAFANSSVTVYGVANLAVSFEDNDLADTTQIRMGGVNVPSRIGFKGEEDLGGGLKAWFMMESAVNLDDGSAGAVNTSGLGSNNATTGQSFLGTREAWVGLGGSFGKVGLGKGKTPYHNYSDIFDIPMSFGSFSTAGEPGLTAAGTAIGVHGSRAPNQIRYDSPVFSGFSASLAYGVGENETSASDASSIFSLSAKYAAGPILVSAAYEMLDDIRYTTGAGAAVVNRDDGENTLWGIGGTYTLGAFKVGFGWQRAETDRVGSDRERDIWQLTGAYTMGATTLQGGYQAYDEVELNGRDQNDTDLGKIYLGVKHALSKRTQVYAEYFRHDFERSNNDVSAFSVGIFHTF